jgi:hypothetical protein
MWNWAGVERWEEVPERVKADWRGRASSAFDAIDYDDLVAEVEQWRRSAMFPDESDALQEERDAAVAENERLRGVIGLAIGRIERGEKGAALMGLKAGRGDFATDERGTG